MTQVEALLKMDTGMLFEDRKGYALLSISELKGQPAAKGADKPPKEDPKQSEEGKLKNKK